MKIDLTKNEVRRILIEKFGEGEFRVFYTESDKLLEARLGKKLKEFEKPPQKESYVLHFDEDSIEMPF